MIGAMVAFAVAVAVVVGVVLFVLRRGVRSAVETAGGTDDRPLDGGPGQAQPIRRDRPDGPI